MHSIARAAAQTAHAVGEAAAAGAEIITAGANVTAVVTVSGATALSTTAGLVTDVWKGVDLLHVEAAKTTLHAAAASQDAMVSHWSSAHASEGFPVNALPALSRCAAGDT